MKGDAENARQENVTQ